MSNSLAIATVTSTLRLVTDRALQAGGPGQVGGARTTTLRPDRIAGLLDADEPSTGVNLFCYQATPNHAWNLTDLPTRNGDGSLARRPVAALDLHYLLTGFGKDETLDDQRLLARAVLGLAVTPVLGRATINEAVEVYGDDDGMGFLVDADLADQPESVKVSPAVMPLEEMARLWATFGTPYLLSLTYTATVVLLEADVRPRTALPVRTRTVGVSAIGPPRVEEVVPEAVEALVGTGSVLVLRGSGLRGPVTRVRIGPGPDLVPGGDLTSQQVVVTVADTVPAGIHALRVLHRSAAGPPGSAPQRTLATSNAIPVMVRPTVSVEAQTRLRIRPSVQPGQRLSISLGRLSGGDPDDPAWLSVDVAPDPPDAPPRSTFDLATDLDDQTLGAGTWLVRVSVDGVESVPTLVAGTYGAPTVTVP